MARQLKAVSNEFSLQFFIETEYHSLNGDPYTGEVVDLKAETVNKQVKKTKSD